MKNEFTKSVNIDHPIICGAMYPCSNVELIAAASEAGGIGIIQPLSLIYVYGKDLRAAIREIKSLTSRPVGFNAIIEASSKKYIERMMSWVDIALDEGVRFFITALGNPKTVVEKVHARQGIVYHDVTSLKWAQKALQSNVDGFICVNNRAGGHAGEYSAAELAQSLLPLHKPLIAAGGISTAVEVKQMLSLGYQGVQLGTRFIASKECNVHEDYKQAIIKATEKDIVLTDKISGVPVAMIMTPMVKKLGLQASGWTLWLLKSPRFKHWVRLFYTLRSLRLLKKSSQQGLSYKDFWQAGKSVEHIHSIESVATIMKMLTS